VLGLSRMTIRADAALHRAASIDDLRALAARRLPRVIFDFVDGGAGAERVLAENRASFGRVTLIPRLLRDARERDASVELFGQRYRQPFGIAPTGMSGLVWPRAELLLAQAACEFGVLLVLSTVASCMLEDIGAECGARAWFQLYASRERAVDRDLIARARQSGFGALVFTADLAVAGYRRRDLRNGFHLPLGIRPRMIADALRHPGWLCRVLANGRLRVPNLERYYGAGVDIMQRLEAQTDPGFDWDALAAIRHAWDRPLLVKGVLSARDAAQALAAGVDGLIVSNHGGRQLDCCPASLDALPDIVDAVGGRIPVLLDSGVRSGEDVARALALGAQAVLVGRATLYGAAAAGRAGIDRALDLIAGELDVAMALLGCRNPTELTQLERRVRRPGEPAAILSPGKVL
jgi:(S)-mandelate dehydrogenase